ncbi:hypothetical protein RJ640_022650, partial [Escallonia rubra]
MDLVFHTLQIGFFYMDFDLISKSIDKAKNLFEEGGDWERKNRLKVYEGLFCMSTRNFKKAADLFLDSILTFTTYELFPYDTFIFYTVLTSIISLDRVSLKQKVHRARLRGDKRDVVVKIQHPGVQDLMMTDIRNLQAFALYMQKTDIKFDLFSITKEVEKQVALLDYGQVKDLPNSLRLGYASLVLAIADNDPIRASESF